MTPFSRRCAGIAVGLCLSLPALAQRPAPPAPPPSDTSAAALLGAAYAATGGAAWDKAREVHLTAKRQAADETDDEDIWIDPRQGLTTVAIAEGAAAGRTGFDGKTAWIADTDGAAHPLKSPERADALADLYWRSAFWTRALRPPFTAAWLRVEGQGSRTADVVHIAAPDMASIDVAFERTNHLPVRIVVHRAPGDQTVRLSQWRKTAGISLPTRLDTEIGKDQPHIVETVTATVVDSNVDAKRFAMPTAPAVDYIFPGDAQSAELPIHILNGHLYINAKLPVDPKLVPDKQAQKELKQGITMLFDTAASAVLDPNAAKKFNLTIRPAAGGAALPTARVSELKVGGVSLRHQSIPIRDLSKESAAEGRQIDGILGYELIRRLTVEIDFEGRRMVLLKPEGFVPPPSATAIPLVMAGRIPSIAGRIDGELATMAVDTGIAAGMIVTDGFAKAHGFDRKWHPVTTYLPLDAGVQGVAQIGRASSLELGVLGVAQPVGWIADQGVKIGDAALGDEFLRRYDVIFDLRNGKLWLQSNHLADKPDDFDRSGLAVTGDGNAIRIIGVVPQSPADRAGLKRDDIVRLVGGERVTSEDLSELRGRLMGAVGSAIALGVNRPAGNESAADDPKKLAFYRVVLADPWPLPKR